MTQHVDTGPVCYLDDFLSVRTCVSHNRKAQYLQHSTVTAYTLHRLNSGSSSSSRPLVAAASGNELQRTRAQ